MDKVKTLDFLGIGDSPLADTASQNMKLLESVALMSALFLSFVIPVFLDAGLSPQTNGYIMTSPEWLGQTFFVFTFASVLFLAFSSFNAVVTMLFLSELGNEHACRYFTGACGLRLHLTTLVFMILGGVSIITALSLWDIIVCFDFQYSYYATITGSVSSMTFWQTHFPIAFGGCILVAILISFVTFVHQGRVVAILYKTSQKFSDPGNTWSMELDAKEIWLKLHNYLGDDAATASAFGFKEFLIRESPVAGALSTRTEQIADWLFEKKMKQSIIEQHEAIWKEMKELKSKDPRFASFPDLDNGI
eukprot:7187607-Prymnesium_polylepis.1